MLIFQQIQNIGMTIGLLPITGITLPFISYGGSSLLSYMILIGISSQILEKNILIINIVIRKKDCLVNPFIFVILLDKLLLTVYLLF